ncbi:oxidoreductase, short chain dehydrogenase/reductase family protein [Neisseria sp. oral taxon 020 str. F0370]|uniref:SDR family NAD(P)-dependent oxidoreductase n=1 Tax=unclassified Neisseria TaxID=2623750 RepID=UPI0002A3F1C2|nr:MULTISPECIES: SDR family NAD(P)-dependent oxidoreductase [unclassified Neisseria]ASP18189.1 short-chain dehydrogenase/reductase [Neisseria sp. KEM232]EKY05650.1 oxidoreductase, short chain dehydrogenase/reductase family protein [Neisseria sp. oral taxon 020 str. F0370]
MQNPSQVWLVTGASGGLGLALVKALLAAGHRVAATTRNADKLAEAVGGSHENLLALTMALTDEADIKRGIAAITERFGRIDITVNNAGYILVGAIEELSDAEIRANFDINVFGMMNVIRAVMPVYRAQKSGRFLNISSISGSVTDPGQAIYSASKAAVIMLTEAVDDEGRDFNVRATAVCPGGLRTSFLGGSARFPEQPIADYASVRQYEENYRRLNQNQSGDPAKAARALITLAAADNPPKRIYLGTDSFAAMERKMGKVAAEMAAWDELSHSTKYEG